MVSLQLLGAGACFRVEALGDAGGLRVLGSAFGKPFVLPVLFWVEAAPASLYSSSMGASPRRLIKPEEPGGTVY